MTTGRTGRDFLHGHAQELAQHGAEHLQLTGVTIALALGFGVSLALLVHRHRGMRSALLLGASVLQTIPGIALLVMAMALFHRIGTAPALFALLLYALLPIVQNTLVGLNSLSPALAEAARGLGLSRWQRLRYVRLPLALPMILAGLRTSAVQTVGLATLAAFVGAGGLGQFINRGLFLSDTRLILLGAVPAALLAVVIHGLLSLAEQALTPGKRRWWMLLVAAAGIALLVVFTVAQLAPQQRHGTITIGSKNFTEQLIVAEMVAQQIERRTDLTVRRRFGLGGSTVVHQALRDGSVDLAVEYTGTALSAILHQPTPANPASVFEVVRDAYARQFHLTWLAPLGFNNSYSLAVRADDAGLRSITTVSQLTTVAPRLTAAFDFEFAERNDGYRGLKNAYGLHFQRVIDMHPDLLYDALRKGNADVISAYATDGRLAEPGLRLLRDDRSFFPPYDAAIVVRADLIEKHPQLETALTALSSTLDDGRMRKLNASVDQRRLSVEQAAHQALTRD